MTITPIVLFDWTNQWQASRIWLANYLGELRLPAKPMTPRRSGRGRGRGAPGMGGLQWFGGLDRPGCRRSYVADANKTLD
jgi:hypothetical protein